MIFLLHVERPGKTTTVSAKLNWMAYSELPWRPLLGHQVWSTLKRGNVFITFTNVFFIFATFFYVFNVLYFYLNVFTSMVFLTLMQLWWLISIFPIRTALVSVLFFKSRYMLSCFSLRIAILRFLDYAKLFWSHAAAAVLKFTAISISKYPLTKTCLNW